MMFVVVHVLFFTAVLHNMQPVLSKTFRDFGFFFYANQTVAIASNTCLSNKGSNIKQKLQN